MSSGILKIISMPSAGPMPTLDPFLFVVYHKDNYPQGPMEGSMIAPFPGGNGHDFDPDSEYRMYHGHRIPGFPQHPHRGFETITATIEGIIDHADSMGNAGRYGKGDVQWMTAGRGVVHGEMFPLVNTDEPNPTRFFQIWLNLSGTSKMVDPSFAMFWRNDIPKYSTTEKKANVTVWFGEYFLDCERDDKAEEKNEDDTEVVTLNPNRPPENSWASDPQNDVAVLHLTIHRGGKLTIPKSKVENVSRSLYLVEGANIGVQVNGELINRKVILELDSNQEVNIYVPKSEDNVHDDGSVEFLMLQGRPIEEKVAQHGPFVMNTWAEISQAFDDYHSTKFGGWPWDSDEMVFPHTKGRFALIDGVETLPTGESIDNEQISSKSDAKSDL